MSIVLQSSGGGSVTINEPTTASNFTQTLPASAGTVMVSGNMPAFSAYQSSAQTLSSATFTKLQLQAELFDTANAFDSTTNYRFTPLVAGFYQLNGQVAIGGAGAGFGQISIYKNGAESARGSTSTNNLSVGAMCTVSNLIYMNGTTDYVELYVYQNSGGSVANQSSTAFNYFSGSLVRAA
jgi:hypothetical protein